MAFNSSTIRYNRLVELTRKLTGIQFIPSGYGPWEALVRVWKLYHKHLQCNDILYATLHSLKWEAYPESKADPMLWALNRGTPLEKDTAELMALFREELTAPGAEGAAELYSCSDFEYTYQNLTRADNVYGHYGTASHSWVHKEYLNNRFNHLVHSFDLMDDKWTQCKWFESIIHDLLPLSTTWSKDKWIDESFILQELDRAYGTNFQGNPHGLTRLADLVDKVQIHLPVSGYPLTALPEFPLALAKNLWPVDTFDQIVEAYKGVLREARENERRAKRRKSKKLEYYEFGYANVKETGIHQLVSDLISTGAINDPSLKTQVFEMQFKY